MFRFTKLAGSARYSCVRFLAIVRLHVSTLGRIALAASDESRMFRLKTSCPKTSVLTCVLYI